MRRRLLRAGLAAVAATLWAGANDAHACNNRIPTYDGMCSGTGSCYNEQDWNCLNWGLIACYRWSEWYYEFQVDGWHCGPIETRNDELPDNARDMRACDADERRRAPAENGPKAVPASTGFQIARTPKTTGLFASMSTSSPGSNPLIQAAAQPPTIQHLDYRIVANVPVSTENALYSLVGIGRNGLVYVGDARNAEVHAFDQTGEQVWATSLAPEIDSTRRAMRALTVGHEDLLFALESGSGDVHVLDADTGAVLRREQVRDTVGTSPQTGLAADNEGGFYLAGTKGPAIHHFSSTGTVDALGDGAAFQATRTRGLDGWVGTAPDGTLFHRRERSVVFQRFSKGRQALSPTVARVPYTSPSDVPGEGVGDMVLNAAVLSGGRVVVQVLQATPHGRDPNGVPRTVVQSLVYLLDERGEPVGMLDSDEGRLGNLSGVTPEDHLVFFIPRKLAKDGQARVLEVELLSLPTSSRIEKKL